MSCTAFALGEDNSQTNPQNPGIDLDKVELVLSSTTFYKTGSPIEPVTVMYDGAVMDESLYELDYVNNVDAGTATATAYFEARTKSKSVEFEILPAKPQIPAITGVTSSLPNVTVAWNGVACTGYDLQISLDSGFAGATDYWQTTTTQTFGGLIDGKTYYFRVRAYSTEGGKTTYGDWSTASSKVKTTGEVGNRFVQNGAFVYDQTVKYGGNYYYYDASGVKRACSKTMWNKVKKAKSGTKYLIAVDCTQNRVCVYQGKKNKWNLKYYWKCATGKKKTPTIKGTFKVSGKVSHFGESKGYSVWYATKIKYEYYFHSILYQPYSKTNVKNGKLGDNLSHGCIRLEMNNAKWIYKNCKKKTKIIIY